jgi:hypothetical protein
MKMMMEWWNNKMRLEYSITNNNNNKHISKGVKVKMKIKKEIVKLK